MVRIGIIGLGYWGPNLIRNFTKLSHCTVVAAVDIDKSRLKLIKKKYPKLNLFQDYEELLPLVDAVVIATPLISHFEIAKKFLESGKHVLVEKPFVPTSHQAQELIVLAKKYKVTLMVDHTFEFSASVQKIRELILKKSLGKIYNIDIVRVNLGIFQKNYNVIWDLAPHDISILRYILGMEPVSVIALGQGYINPEIEDSAHLYLRFPKKVTATIYLSWLAPTKIRKLTIVGSKKMLEYDDTVNDKIKVFNKGVNLETEKSPRMDYYQTFQEFKYVYRQGEQKVIETNETEPLEVMADHFINSIKNKTVPLTSGQEAKAVVSIIEGAQKSLRLGGKEVFFDDKK